MYRKDFTQLTNIELTRLANGFNHLWSNGTIQAFAILHDNNFNGGIIHWSPSFLPWHRDFLRQIEIQLQAFDSQITLPYWDWTRGDSRDLNAGVCSLFLEGEVILVEILTIGHILEGVVLLGMCYLHYLILFWSSKKILISIIEI